jgi:hypothetical protein
MVNNGVSLDVFVHWLYSYLHVKSREGHGEKALKTLQGDEIVVDTKCDTTL